MKRIKTCYGFDDNKRSDRETSEFVKPGTNLGSANFGLITSSLNLPQVKFTVAGYSFSSTGKQV